MYIQKQNRTSRRWLLSHPASSSVHSTLDYQSTSTSCSSLSLTAAMIQQYNIREPKQTPNCESTALVQPYHNITTFKTNISAAAFCSVKQAAMSKKTTKPHKTIYISWYTIAFFSQQSFMSWSCAKLNDIKHISYAFIKIYSKSHQSSEVRIDTKQEIPKHTY